MNTRVYVGRLGYGCRETDLERFFRGYGRIREILLKNGFAFVEFEDYKDADDAVYDLNGKELLGERVVLEIARGPSRRGRFPAQRRGNWSNRYGPARTGHRVVVENLSSRVSWQDLKDFMRQAGDVTYADAHKQRRNEGVVQFSTYADMKNAISKLDGMELHGRRIKLYEERPRRSRSHRSGSKSSSRSRSSRSHSRLRKSRSRSRDKSQSQSEDDESTMKSPAPSVGDKCTRKSPSLGDESAMKSPDKSSESPVKSPAGTELESKSGICENENLSPSGGENEQSEIDSKNAVTHVKTHSLDHED